MVTVLTQGDVCFMYNLEYLKNGLQQDYLWFQGSPIDLSTTLYFCNKRCLYDFTRSAKASVRDNMTSFLVNELGQPELQAPLRAAFNSLYDYWRYKVGMPYDSLSMLIFVYNQGGQFVAHVAFNSKTFISASDQYEVAITMVCQRFTYFQLRNVSSTTSYEDISLLMSTKPERMVTVLTQGEFCFSYNLEYLENRLQQGNLWFQGSPTHLSTTFDFGNKRGLYDFTRSAKALVRDNMTSFLVNELGQPELQAPLHVAFNSLYNYWEYKSGKTYESLSMLIFVYNQGGQFVAKVIFNSNAFLSAPNQYTVAVTLVCQRFTHFQLRDVLSTQMGQLHLS